MKLITENLKHEILKSMAGVSTKSLKWDSIFDSEQELIATMMTVEADENKTLYHKLPKGYMYINSFKNYYIKNGTLTDKQVTQLKRLAVSIAYTKFVKGY